MCKDDWTKKYAAVLHLFADVQVHVSSFQSPCASASAHFMFLRVALWFNTYCV